jgi:hypothetical protein
MARHSTVTLTYPFTGELVDIDEMLVDLIQEVWRAGIETVSCCEDAGDISELLNTAFPHLAARKAYLANRCYVDFPSDGEAATFLSAVADAGPRDEFYVRMVHWAAPGAWLKSLSFDDMGMSDDDVIEHASDFVPSMVQVLFPQPDVPEVVARLQRHNAGVPPTLGEIDWRSVEIDADDSEGLGTDETHPGQ